MGAASAQGVWFEPNRGQVAGQTEWIGRSKGAYLYITGNEVVYANKRNVHMRLVGAAQRVHAEGVEPTGGISSYFTGRDEKTWFTGIPHYAKLRYREVYPGIDMVYYGTGRNVEYDFVVKPGGEPERIELAFSEPVRVDGNGDLVVAGLRQRRPRVMQDGQEVQAAYRISENGRVRIALARYGRESELTIDPVLEFSTYLGGPGYDTAADVKTDNIGNIYLVGGTQSPATPSLNPFQQSNIIGLAPFVFKFSPDAKRVLWYVVLGSNGYESASRVLVDSSGTPIVAGITRTTTFPIKNAFQPDFGGGSWDDFITKVSLDGRSLVYSSYLGGSDNEDPRAIAFDGTGGIYLGGATWSRDFPVKNAFQARFGGGSSDAFLVKISSAGSLLWATLLGGDGHESCESIAVYPDGGPLCAGGSTSTDFPLKNPVSSTRTPKAGFFSPALFRFTADGQLIYSTYLGNQTSVLLHAVAFDSAGNIVVAGTGDAGFPTSPGALQPRSPAETGTSVGILASYDPTLKNLRFSTYFGGSAGSEIWWLGLDGSNSIYISGFTSSADFPLKNSFQQFKGGGILQDDCFVAKFTASGTGLVYSTVLGGGGNEQWGQSFVDRSGNLFTVGATASFDFPVKNAFQEALGGGSDAFLAKISDSTPVEASPLAPSPSRLTFRFVQGTSQPLPQTVVVTGGGFIATATSPWLTAKTTASAVDVTVNPAGLAPGIYNASVTLTPQAGGTSAAVDVVLNVLAPPAVLTAVEPAIVPVGADDVEITVRGSGFVPASVLQVDGIPWLLTPVRIVDAQTVRFSLPASYVRREYNYSIAVQNPSAPLSNLLPLSVGRSAPSFTAASVTNAASFAQGPVAPGEIVTIFGTNLAGPVTFDNIPATVIYSSATQISATVPYTVQGPTTILRVGSSIPVKLDVAPSAPGIFAAVSDPANGVVTLYATGCGLVSQEDLPRCTLPVSVTINGLDAPVLYAGIAPGLPEGANQINVSVPDLTGPLRIVLKAGEAVSKEYVLSLP